ncbi:centrosomal protein of 70 kDa isoform X2 [Takifugu flavidus]|uniref:centrosomal protein of 70 kDa isoform X2 n=1 Tax=Takifugu flavidus TaxID=433684 RepID=UPI0025443DF0|nr:centrosomal protein of 70 kDa isoform X2 [Takifugu flavidus]
MRNFGPMEEEEQVDWDEVNKLLQHHGFKPVKFADPVENKNLSDLVLLDKKSAAEIRMTLKTMLMDSERRQALIQEIIKTNNHLKEEVREHMSRAAQHSQRATELEGLLATVKTRVQDLEDRCLGKAVQQLSHTHQLQQENREARIRCQALEQKLSKQMEEAAQLQKKLYFSVKEEELRVSRQRRAFQDICNKVCQQNSPTDQQVLEVIDFYETEMSQMLDKLRSVKGQPETAHWEKTKKETRNVTPSLKTLLKAYQEQQQESKVQIEELKKEVKELKQEVETRPTVKEVKFYKHKLRRLEALDKHSNIRLPQDVEMTENANDGTVKADLCDYYHNLLKEISSIASDHKAPLRLYRQNPSSVDARREEFQTLLPTLEAWAQQLHLLKDLQKGLNKLRGRLMPCLTTDDGHSAAEAVKVEDMMLLVDTILENSAADDDKVFRSPTKYTLSSMVSHFQKLFDVTSLSGVYPRMNEVYTRLGEMTNMMRNLRDVLELDSKVSPPELVNHVARLVSSTEHTVTFQTLLRDDDIDSILVKLKQHEEFFPAFHALTVDILQTLGVGHLDDILPALRSLRQAANSYVA